MNPKSPLINNQHHNSSQEFSHRLPSLQCKSRFSTYQQHKVIPESHSPHTHTHHTHIPHSTLIYHNLSLESTHHLPTPTITCQNHYAIVSQAYPSSPTKSPESICLLLPTSLCELRIPPTTYTYSNLNLESHPFLTSTIIELCYYVDK